MGTLSAIELIKILKIVKGMNDKKKNKKRKHKRRRIKTNLLNNNNKSTHPLMGSSTYFQNPNLNTDIQREQLNNYIQEKNKLKAIENNEYKTLHDKYNNLENNLNNLTTTANNFLEEYNKPMYELNYNSDDDNKNNHIYELNYNSDDETKSNEILKPFNFDKFLISDNIDVPTNDFNLNSHNQANIQTIENTTKDNTPKGGYSLDYKPKENKILNTASKYMNRIFNNAKIQPTEEEKKDEVKKDNSSIFEDVNPLDIVSNDKTSDLLPDEKSNIVIEDEEEKKNDDIEIKNLLYKTPITYIKHIEKFQSEYAKLYMQYNNKEPNKDTNKNLKGVKNNKDLNELDDKYHKLKSKIDELKEKISKSNKKIISI